MGYNINELERIGDRIRTILCGRYKENILILPSRGGISLCLKGFSLGILYMKKRGMVFSWDKDKKG